MMKKIGKTKRLLSLFLAVIMLLGSAPFLGKSGITMKASAIDSRVERAVQTAVAIANDDSHGYSQSNRWGPDYDCSSLVYYAFSSAGFSLYPTWFNTGNMGGALMNAGFTEISNINLSSSANLQRGDILWKPGHTEIYIGGNKLVGAHYHYGYTQTGDQNGMEISVLNYYYVGDNGSSWTKVYRYEGAPESHYLDVNTYVDGKKRRPGGEKSEAENRRQKEQRAEKKELVNRAEQTGEKLFGFAFRFVEKQISFHRMILSAV